MAIIDANNKAHSEVNGRFVGKDAQSANDMKSELVQELPNEEFVVKNAQEDESPKFGSQEELDKFLGEEFKGYKGQAAIDKLLQEKRGHVKAAFHRDDIGVIDLVWGNDKAGIGHAIEQRMREKNGEAHAKDMLENLSEAVTRSVFDKQNKYGNFEFIYKKNRAEYFVIIAPEYNRNKITYVITSFRRGKIKSTE